MKNQYKLSIDVIKNLCDSQAEKFDNSKKTPLIGVSLHQLDEHTMSIRDSYTEAIINSGGIPIVIPITSDVQILRTVVSKLDGLLLTGGGDINSEYLGEHAVPQLSGVNEFRDQYDFLLLKLADDRQIPTFGICRGIQIINVFFGGTIYQDISSQTNHPNPSSASCHSQSYEGTLGVHNVEIQSDTILSTLYKEKSLFVNSFHHQAIKDVAPGFITSAISDDGIIEGIESVSKTGKSIFGVQWHPERMVHKSNNLMKDVFAYFISEALNFKIAKSIHKKYIILDSHTDTPMLFGKNFNIASRENDKTNLSRVTIPKLQESFISSVFMVAYLKQGLLDEKSLKVATKKADTILEKIKNTIQENSKSLILCDNKNDVNRAKREHKVGIFLGIENGYALANDVENVEYFAKKGVKYITLCHNGDNQICDSAKGKNTYNGLSDFGIEVVKRMNLEGIMIDVSHTSEKTTRDVLNFSSQPIIASHSSAKALCSHPRNLSDELILAIANGGGVVQVCLYGGFLKENGDSDGPSPANIDDIIAHIKHVTKVAGIDHVGIGSDFDGDGGVLGCWAENEMINITKRLLKEGYSEKDLKKLWGANLLRVMKEVKTKSALYKSKK